MREKGVSHPACRKQMFAAHPQCRLAGCIGAIRVRQRKSYEATLVLRESRSRGTAGVASPLLL